MQVKLVYLLVITTLIISTASASEIILNPTSTPCFFVWQLNYTDASNLIVGDDYIEHGGIKIHAISNKTLEFDILEWNPSVKALDGAVIITLKSISNESVNFTLIIQGLIANKYYTVIKDGSTFIITKASEQGLIEFNDSTVNSHIYEILTGYQPNITESNVTILGAITEKTVFDEVIELLECAWWILLILIAIVVYVALRRC